MSSLVPTILKSAQVTSLIKASAKTNPVRVGLDFSLSLIFSRPASLAYSASLVIGMLITVKINVVFLHTLSRAEDIRAIIWNETEPIFPEAPLMAAIFQGFVAKVPFKWQLGDFCCCKWRHTAETGVWGSLKEETLWLGWCDGAWDVVRSSVWYFL